MGMEWTYLGRWEADRERSPKYPSLSSLVLITSTGANGGGKEGGELKARDMFLD